MSDAISVIDWLFNTFGSIYTFMSSVFILQVVLGLLFLPKIIDFFRKLLGGG